MARSLSFVIDSDIDSKITITEQDDGTLLFEVEVLDTGLTGDLRGVFFDVAGMPGIEPSHVTGADVTEVRIDADMIDTVGQDANVKGEVSHDSGKFDVGVEIGTSGMSGDDIQSTSFTISGLSIDDISLQEIALRYTSVGTIDGDRSGSLKILGEVPTTPPDALDDAVTIEEDSPGIVIDLLANDSDPDGDTLTIDSFDLTGLKGTVTDNGDGTVTYDPNGQFDDLNDGDFATDSFIYKVSDGNGGFDTATVEVTVEGEDPFSGKLIVWDGPESTVDRVITAAQTVADKYGLVVEDYTSPYVETYPDGTFNPNGYYATMFGNALAAAGPQDIVIFNNYWSYDGIAQLEDYAAGDGALIASFWDLDAVESLQTALSVDTVGSFRDPKTIDFGGTFGLGTFSPTDNQHGDDGDNLSVTDDGYVAATFADGSNASVVTDDGTQVVNGFMPDNYADGSDIIAAQIEYLIDFLV